MRKIVILGLVLVMLSTITSGCTWFVTKQQRASEDCLVKGNQAACAYVDDLKVVYEQEQKVEAAQAKLEAAQAELERLEKEAKKSQKLWEASNQPTKQAPPTGTPVPSPTPPPTVGP